MNTRRNSKLYLPGIVIIAAFIVVSLLCVQSAGANNYQDFVGSWFGNGKIIVAWCDQDQITLDLTIDAGGNVTGTVGDARLKKGKLSKRNFMMRLLKNRAFIIKADMEGDIVAAEKIHRESIAIFLEMKDGQINASFNTSGSKTGGKDKMYMSAIDFTLSRHTPRTR